jgi:ribosomal protein S18 acetylase RimI-like enzyme
MTAESRKRNAVWRPMRDADLPAVADISRIVHPDYPEDDPVFEERLTLYPQGCRVLVADDRACHGYILSHPWDGPPPKLNTLLGTVPAAGRRYYIHDLTILPGWRSTGIASVVVRSLLTQAYQNGFTTAALVAVNHSNGFWRRHGFAITDDPSVAGVLRSYGEGVHYMTADLTAR